MKKKIIITTLVCVLLIVLSSFSFAKLEPAPVKLPKNVIADLKLGEDALCGTPESNPCPEKPNDIGCKCREYCVNSGQEIKKEGDTCGGIEANCIDKGGLCKNECDEETEKPNPEAYCKKIEKKCCVRDKDCSPIIEQMLEGCDRVCKCPNKCKCTDTSCLKGGEWIDAGQRCDGGTGFQTACEGSMFQSGLADLPNEEIYTWNDVCPPGCEWFNDPRCGVKKGAMEALWDVWLKKTAWGKKVLEWETKWSDFWADYGRSLTFEQQMKNICHKGNLRDLKVEEGTMPFLEGDLQGWMGAERAIYNINPDGTVDFFMYTFSLRLGGMSHDNKYKIFLSGGPNGEEEKVVPGNPDIKWVNITAGSMHAGADFSKVWFSKTNYTKIKVVFDKIVCDRCTNGRNVCFRDNIGDCEAFLCLEDECKKEEDYYKCDKGSCLTQFSTAIGDVGSDYTGRGEPLGSDPNEPEEVEGDGGTTPQGDTISEWD